MFYNDLKFKVNFLEVNNPGKKPTPFSRLPKKSLDSKPLKISTVFGKPFDFVEIILKVLVPVQPFAGSKSCKIQGIISGQVTDFPGNIQNTHSKYGVLIPSGNTIRFDGLLGPYQKPFVFYHIKHTYQSDVYIIPFSFYLSFAPTNRIYFTSILTKKLVMVNWMIVGQLRVARENKPLTKTIKLILSSDHIQIASLNEASGHMTIYHSLIYGIHICKQNIKNKHREAMTINDYSSMFSIFKMHKKYAFSLKCVHINISHLVYIYVQNLSFGFDKDDSPKRGFKGDSSPFRTYICTK